MAFNTSSRQQRIFCGELGSGYMYSVTIAMDAHVRDLQLAIGHKMKYDPLVASSLILFLARKPSGWLRIDAARVAWLKNRHLPLAAYTRMSQLARLNQVEYFGPTFTPEPRQLHVLVQLPDTAASFLRVAPTSLQWRFDHTREFPQLVTTDSDACVTVPFEYLADSGLRPPRDNGPLVLFKRNAFREQWRKIQGYSIDSHANLFIVGAPGSGKSCATYAFVCSQLDRTQWAIVWIHADLHDEQQLQLVLLLDNDKAVARVGMDQQKRIAATLDELEATINQSNQRLLVVLDGYNESIAALKDVELAMRGWQVDAPEKRRFVCVVSQGDLTKWGHSLIGREIGRCDGKNIYENSWLVVPSWTREQYIEAVKQRCLLENVVHNLCGMHDDEPTLTVSTDDLVMSKYFYAGGSAKLMFSTRLDHVLELLDAAAADIPSLESLMRAQIGPTYPREMYELLALHPLANRADHEHYLVSLYAVQRVAERFGGGVLQDVARRFGFETALHTRYFHKWFLLALLGPTGVACYIHDASGDAVRVLEVWSTRCVHCFYPLTEQFALPFGWSRPVGDRSHAAYDVVYWDVTSTQSRRLVIAQILASHEQPGFAREPLQRLLTQIVTPVDVVELWFVVPRGILSGVVVPTTTTRTFYASVASMGTAYAAIATRVRLVGVDYDVTQMRWGW